MNRMMPLRCLTALAAMMLLLPPTSARGAERVVREFAADDFETNRQLNQLMRQEVLSKASHGSTTAPAGPEYVAWSERAGSTTVAADAPGPHTVPLLTIDNGSDLGTDYAITGSVSYRDIDGDAYLELWSYFPDGGAFFSRSLASSGPMMKITGSSATRPFTLPFHSRPGYEPTKLVLNLVLPGRGKVTLDGVTLVAQSVPAASALASDLPRLAAQRNEIALKLETARQKYASSHPVVVDLQSQLEATDRLIATLSAAPAPAPAPAAVADENPPTRLRWLDEHFAAEFAGLIGFAAFLVIPMRLLVRRGKGRWFVLGVMLLIIAVGLADLGGAVAAILLRRPPSVTLYLLASALAALLCGAVGFRGAQDLYRRLELRKMAALDAG